MLSTDCKMLAIIISVIFSFQRITHSSDTSKGPRVELRGREAGELISILATMTSKVPQIEASYIWKHCDDVSE